MMIIALVFVSVLAAICLLWFPEPTQAEENAEAMRKMLIEHGVIDPLPEPAEEPAPAKQPSAFSAWLKQASNPYPDYLHKPAKMD